MIHTRFSRIELRPWGIITRFEDGSESANWPPADPAFLACVRSVEFHDPILYVQHHDLCHTYLSEKLFSKPSPTLWAAAHGLPADNAFEERLVWEFQRECVHLFRTSRAQKRGIAFDPTPGSAAVPPGLGTAIAIGATNSATIATLSNGL